MMNRRIDLREQPAERKKDTLARDYHQHSERSKILTREVSYQSDNECQQKMKYTHVNGEKGRTE